MTHDLELLQAARIGYQHQLAEVEARIAELTSKPQPQPQQRTVSAPQPGNTTRRKMSPAGRKRIAEATKKRWAEWRAKKNKTGSAAA